MARHGEDAYPVSRFVLDRARALLMTRGGLVRRLGYLELPYRPHRAQPRSNNRQRAGRDVGSAGRCPDCSARPR